MKEGQSWISFLRITATMAVVWLHTNGTIWGNQDLFPLSEDQIHFFAVNYYLMYWAVPVFFMMTGALLLQKDNTISISYCLRRYVSRMCLVLLIFGTGYSYVMLVASGNRNALVIIYALRNVLIGKTFAHMWYCYEMIGVYLILPVLKAFVDRSDRKTLELLCVILFVFDFVFPFISVIAEAQVNFYLPFSYSIFYVLLGHELESYISINKSTICLVVIATLAITGVLAYLDPVEGNRLISYNSPVVAISASVVFLLFMKETDDSDLQVAKKRKEMLWDIDRSCFGIYLIHPLFIQVMYRVLGITPVSFKTYQFGTVIIWVMVLSLSYISIWVLRRIKLVREYIL